MTSTPLTNQQLNDIDTRQNATTVGPWRQSEDYNDIHASDGDHVASYWQTADGEFIAHAPEDVRALLAEVRRLRGVLEEIRHLHKDSPMGPCPVCIDADAAAAGGDGLVPYPCPTGRLAGAQDCDPPSFRTHPAAVPSA